MRFLLASSEFPPGPGGIGTHAFELARHLAARGHRVTVAATQDYADDAAIDAFNANRARDAEHAFDVVRLHRSRWLRGPLAAVGRAWTLRALRRRLRPDVMIASGERIGWLVALVAGRTPWLAVGHGVEFGAPQSPRGRLTRRAFSRADALVCVSEHTRRAAERCGVRPGCIEVIPNGADDKRFSPLPDTARDAFRARHGLRTDRLLVTVGHLSERKGQDIVVDALALLAERHDVTYMAIGMPTLREELLDRARHLGIDHRLRLPGILPDAEVADAVAAADVFVMTSRHTGDGDFEGYGIAVVEAVLCGTPSVVSGGSGLAEAVDGGATGVVVPQNDPPATAAALDELLSDPAHLDALGTEARRRAVTEKTWAKRVDRYEVLLRWLAARATGDATRERTSDVDSKHAPWQPTEILYREERRREAARLLHRAGAFPRRGDACLEIGYGRIGWLGDLLGWGLRAGDLHGIELDAERAALAREALPGADLRVGDASALPWDDDRFRLVVVSTVFTSILDPSVRAAVAAEIERVLAPDGALLWYDFRVDNPRNPRVRRVGRRELRRLFPTLRGTVRSVALAPPLARRVAPISRRLADLLGALPPLRTHLLAVLRPVARRSPDRHAPRSG